MTPSLIPPEPPAIPLTPAIRAAYKELYAKYEAAIENTCDPGLLTTLNASQTNVDNVLTKDDMYRLHKGTVSLQTILDQINCTNAELKVLKNQIAAVASHVAKAGEILEAINKVLTLVPGA